MEKGSVDGIEVWNGRDLEAAPVISKSLHKSFKLSKPQFTYLWNNVEYNIYIQKVMVRIKIDNSVKIYKLHDCGGKSLSFSLYLWHLMSVLQVLSDYMLNKSA